MQNTSGWNFNKDCLTSAAITNFSKTESDAKHGIHGCYVRPTQYAIPNSDKSPEGFRSVFSQRYRQSSPGTVLSESAARATRHRPESSSTRRAYLFPLDCVVMPLKTDLKSSGDGPEATFLLNLLTPPGMGSLGVRFALTRFL